MDATIGYPRGHCAPVSMATAFELMTCSVPAFAVPPNPDRPLKVQTCAAALDRYGEALAGNPLVSAEEMAAITARAHDDVLRLCRDRETSSAPAKRPQDTP